MIPSVRLPNDSHGRDRPSNVFTWGTMGETERGARGEKQVEK